MIVRINLWWNLQGKNKNTVRAAFMRTTVLLFGVGHTTLVPFNGTIKQNEVDEEFEDIVDHFENEMVQVAT